jgi:cytochrome c oxidase subunit 2
VPKYSDYPFIPPQASELAPHIDLVILGLTLLTVAFTVAICLAMLYFVVRYRRGKKVDRSNPQLYNLPIEIAWTGLPMLIAIGIFVWSTAIYLRARSIPAGAMEVYVVGKQWMWKLQHPEGRWEMNELHVPSGKPIELVMTSEDVIHSFFVPELRVKQDVIPGQYTRLWFNATRPGTYHLFCSQFCGTLHSRMTGTVTVMDPADYARWLNAGNTQGTLAQAGEQLFHSAGCSGCHGPGASVRAPMLEGIYGHPIAVQIPRGTEPLERVPATTMIADDRYIHDSIVLPEKEVAAGFRPIMPTFQNRLTEDDIFKLTAYLRSLANTTGGVNQGSSRSPTADEYKARTGFIPENMKDIERGAVTPGSPAAGGPAGAAGNQTNERMPR